ncbi:hypothetical protein AN948_01825 [Rhodococcus sp. ADH]|nr:hypothetical protein AN948_01825 [Rhodococcus sp. ADH]RGP46709.1 hypothetical protein AWH04_06240 [Rhodococcus erythropolis]
MRMRELLRIGVRIFSGLGDHENASRPLSEIDAFESIIHAQTSRTRTDVHYRHELPGLAEPGHYVVSAAASRPRRR